MSKTTIQVIIATLMALLFSFGAQATEPDFPDEGGNPAPMQCLWFLKNCAPPPQLAPVNKADDVAAN